ncbi:hypothetical protein B0919_19245 [Hymenobacter sp. CRA2]|nr:hypothetical protein B0919_19245 [Hymenobacter sp. CRA2]
MPRAVVLLSAAALLGLLWYALAPGLAGTSDSRFYLAAAASWAGSGRLLNPDGTPYTSWGPLYPVLLAPGVEQERAWTTALQLLSTLLCWAGWSWLAWQLLPQRYLATGLVAALAVAAPWLVTAKFVWSEPVFQALFAGYASCLYAYLRNRRFSWWAAATVLGLLLPLQRMSGLFLLLGVGLGLLVYYGYEWRAHWRRWLIHALVIGLGNGAWLLYAKRAAATPELYRSRGWQGLRETLGDYGYVLTRWLVPVQQAGWPKHWLFELILPVLLLSLGYAVWRSRAPFVRLLGTVVLCYLLCHIGTTVMSRAGGNVYDVERYAAVVYGAFLLVLAEAAASLQPRRPWLRWVLALWLLYPVARAGRVAHFCHQMQVLSWPTPRP